LPATLDSVTEALGRAVEIIVADGGSTDGTAELARERARLVESAPGRGRQLNAGAECARSDSLLFLHADTWLSPSSGAALGAALERPDIVGGCFPISLRETGVRHPMARLLELAINARTRFFRTATGDQAIFAKRSAFDAVGGFSDDDLFEDVLFYRRLRRLGKTVVLDTPVLTSDRRWRRLGYIRTVTTHLLLRVLFMLGVPLGRLARLYHRLG
jgi:rSAM/selenodomain-associated transferase 2